MELERLVEISIVSEADKLILRHQAYHNRVAEQNRRKTRRLQNAILVDSHKPQHWLKDRRFDPFYVKKNAKSIARSITKKILNRTYCPEPVCELEVPKNGGGVRKVNIYQIPDAAISTLFYRKLLKKNRHRFSSFAYAYRNDRNVHFAIQDIFVELSQNSRMFIAEFDFAKFFDSISHDFIFSQFGRNGFLISPDEEFIIRAFLDCNSVSKRGIPQGTSISLFLANLVCWRLDKSLEREGLQFARYADDSIIWSKDHSKISRAIEIISEFSYESGVSINAEKSDGISLLCNESHTSEFASRKSKVDFLGYSISANKISIKESSIQRIQQQISYILYKHLIQPLIHTPLRAKQIPSPNSDQAFQSAICEIRRYMYGNLSEEMIRSYLSGKSNRIFFKGIMSFYPLINDTEQLKSLDGWLVNAIFKAVKKRAEWLNKHNKPNNFPPYNINERGLLEYCSSTQIKNKHLLRIPSFMTMYCVIQKGLVEFGIAGIVNPASDPYNYSDSKSSIRPTYSS
jgi:RNA-directed DNA polymerase